MDSSPQATSTFHRFLQLPPELREIIWQNSIESIGPRVIAFQQKWWRNRTNRIPALLHVCQESRTLALKRWKWITTERDLENEKRYFDIEEYLFSEDDFFPPSTRHYNRLRDDEWINPKGEPCGKRGCFVDYENDILIYDLFRRKKPNQTAA